MEEEECVSTGGTNLLDIDHDEAVNLRVLLLIKPTVGQRHLGGYRFLIGMLRKGREDRRGMEIMAHDLRSKTACQLLWVGFF